VEGDAPENGENWFVMINVPENIGQDWDKAISETRKNIIEKINRMLKTNIEPHIVHETVRDPRNIEKETFSYRGSLYGNSSNSSLAAFRRHPNHRNDIHGLYFVGGSVHPGGGIPLCLASARIVDHQIVKHYY
jgi:phytoene dehydrogenase-like protein